MVEKLKPELNKVYFIENYSLFQILEGKGSIEVDFKIYDDWEDKIIYLDKGQYIKFLSDDFHVRKIEFPNEVIFKNKEVRVLFKHLISLGYINYTECSDCQEYLEQTVFSENSLSIVDISSKQWFWQNPFKANKEEYQVIFDTKDIIDKQFANKLTSHDITELINENGYNAHFLMKNKIGLTVKNLIYRKKLNEGKKLLAFSDKNVQEVAYHLGYDDAAYFNRVFKKETGQNPTEFRYNFDFPHRNRFAQNLIELIKIYHTEEHRLEFYAKKMNLSGKALSKKVRVKMNTSIGQLIRSEIISTAKKLLSEKLPINEVADRLGFEESNHFSAFFRHYTNLTPSGYQLKKYKI